MHHTLDRPDCKKKAYVRLAPDFDALDVANKVSNQYMITHSVWYSLLSLSDWYNINWNFIAVQLCIVL